MSLLRFTKTLLQTRTPRLSTYRYTVPHLLNRFYTTTIPESKDADAILNVLKEVKEESQTTQHYNDLMKELALNGRSMQAQKVYDQVFRDHFNDADINTYSQLMLAYMNDGKYEDAMEIYYELRDHEDSPNNSVKNLQLDADTYAVMIASLTDPKNMALNGTQFDPTAEPLYEYSVEDVDSAIYQDIEGDSQPALLTALTLFNDMRHLEIQPTPSMYTSMLKACVQQKDGYVLEKLHKLIRMDLYLDPDISVFNHLMEAYSVVGDSAAVLEIWDTAAGYDEKSVSIVLKTCLEHGLATRSQSIYEAAKQQHMKIPVEAFNDYLLCQLRKKTVEEVTPILDQALANGEANESSVKLVDKYKQ